MYTVFKKYLLVVSILGLTLFAFSSCSDDIVLEPLDSLLGEYDGQFSLTDLSQGGAGSGGVEVFNVSIDWIFRDFTYELDDTTSTICSPSGDYTLSGDQVNLNEKFAGLEGGVCDPSRNPIGVFSLRRPADSLILTQVQDEKRFEIRLKRVQQ